MDLGVMQLFGFVCDMRLVQLVAQVRVAFFSRFFFPFYDPSVLFATKYRKAAVFAPRTPSKTVGTRLL